MPNSLARRRIFSAENLPLCKHGSPCKWKKPPLRSTSSGRQCCVTGCAPQRSSRAARRSTPRDWVTPISSGWPPRAAARSLPPAARVAAENRPAAVNFSFASSASFNAVLAAALSGELGTLQRVDISASFARWPRDWQQAGPWLSRRQEGGFTREVLSHFVFATQRLTGPLTLRAARPVFPADGMSAETALTANLVGNGMEVAIDAALRGEVSDTNLWTVTGSAGAIRMRDWYALERRTGNGPWLPAMPGNVDALRAEAGQRQLDQLAALLEGRSHTLASFDEALAVQRTIGRQAAPAQHADQDDGDKGNEDTGRAHPSCPGNRPSRRGCLRICL